MSSLSSVYIKRETLKTLLDVVSKKNEGGVELTISINDEVNDYDQNLTAYVSQSKEDRDVKKKRYYVGNGKVFWTDGVINKAEKKQEQQEYVPTYNSDGEEIDDLPF